MKRYSNRSLTPRQLDALRLLADGWEAIWWGGRDACAGLQQGKIGYGGPLKPLHASTLFGLRERGLLVAQQAGMIGVTAYRISERGREWLAGATPKEET